MSRQSVCLRRYPVPVRSTWFLRLRPPTTSEKVPGFPVVPPSPATAAFLREPVAPPSTHTSHEGLLEPGFIRSLMRGIERDEHDGFSLEDPSEGRYASVHARDSFASTSYRDSLASSAYPRDSFQARHHPYDYSVEDLRTQTEDLEELEPPLFGAGSLDAQGGGPRSFPRFPRSQTHFDSLNPSGVRSSVPPRVSRPLAQRRARGPAQKKRA
ncbi:hypothetical protein AG1IA_10071 [Rhizoctonia solani AG-1 IA]|uniref:Uncharacterized protein n=1 Tax=Thanatephorus cucumeris (strain AG1-IA) TaxID=983506 RepID=L8WHQ2_THACA|nr:hypothetical protein AG1IA_10071 [Rhizoctonia solani AG-1 IA]